MTVDQWYQQRKGQVLLVPGAAEENRGQCVMAADYALNEVYGQPYVWLNAIDWWNQFDSTPQLKNNFDKVTNGVIKKGDFVIFNQTVGSVYGHIDIAMEDGTFNQFTGADSNWGGNKTLHLVNHVGSQYVIGALRKKGTTMDKITKAQEQVMSLMQTGSLPGKDYNYRFTGLPLTQVNLDAMLNFWKAQKRPTSTTVGTTKQNVLDYISTHLM